MVLLSSVDRQSKKHTDCDLGHDGDSLPKEVFLRCGSAQNGLGEKKMLPQISPLVGAVD
jgi:hypothetical protein